MTSTTSCPCGSNLVYAACCGRYHKGASAPNAEALMRARYSAYVLKLGSYLSDTWHSTTRPAEINFNLDEPGWCGLEICSTRGGTGMDQYGEVEFIARWCSRDGRCGALHELSRFVREAGRWYYVDGDLYPAITSKIGRNDLCPCGSGRKFKHCCAK